MLTIEKIIVSTLEPQGNVLWIKPTKVNNKIQYVLYMPVTPGVFEEVTVQDLVDTELGDDGLTAKEVVDKILKLQNNLEETISDLATEKTNRANADQELKSLIEKNVLSFELNEIRLKSVEQKISETTDKVNTFEERIKTLEFESNRDFFVAGYTKDGTDAKPVKEYGNKAILKEFYPYLVDTRTTDSKGNPIDAISKDGERLRPVGQLMSNNFLRFTDGDFAPVVGITQEQYDECMTNALYLDSNGDDIYCEAGKYNAEKYFEEIREELQANPLVENPKKLYKKTGDTYEEVTHYLKPYETIDPHYSIVMGAPHKLYVLDEVEGESGLIWKGLFLNATIWDGINVSEYVLDPTGVSPCPVTLIDEDGVQKT